jgi:hypothetical protein
MNPRSSRREEALAENAEHRKPDSEGRRAGSADFPVRRTWPAFTARVGDARGRVGKPALPATLVCTLGLLAPALLAEPLGGGRFTLDGRPVTGGGQSGGGAFAVAGAAGNAPSAVSQGGTFTVAGGLVGVAVVPGDVTPQLALTDTGDAKLTWSGDATGYVLEFTPVIGEAADWQPVTPAPVGNTFTTPFNQPLRFFRLRKP